MLTPLEAYCHNLRDEFLLMVWWPEEKAKKRKLDLESEGYPYLQSLVEDAERASTRLRVEIMDPDFRYDRELRLLFLNYDIESVSAVCK